jgi:hypothetical protein
MENFAINQNIIPFSTNTLLFWLYLTGSYSLFAVPMKAALGP